jgi:S1-C subfamily serine protease
MSDGTSDPLTQLSASLTNVIAGAAPAVVSVHSHRALSSGFFWKSGLIVTADEALADEGEVSVTPKDGQRVAARIVGRDPTTDVALLAVDYAGTPASFSDQEVSVGSLALAAGASVGGPVAAFGMVAAAGPAWRSMRGGHIDRRIELDLALPRHAEGGLAVDASGQAIGMTVFGPRRRVLVIPAATIARVAPILESKGRIPRGYLGLGLQRIAAAGGGAGAMVMSVDPNGPGAAADLHQGDVLTAWDGATLEVRSLLNGLGPESIGRAVVVAFSRGGETHETRLIVGERPLE